MKQYAWISFSGPDGAKGVMGIEVPEGTDHIYGIIASREDFARTGEDWICDRLNELISADEMEKIGYETHPVTPT